MTCPSLEPPGNELVLADRAFSINVGEVSPIEQRPEGWRPGQDTSGVVVREAADGSGPAGGTRVVAYPEWHGWAERLAAWRVDAMSVGHQGRIPSDPVPSAVHK